MYDMRASVCCISRDGWCGVQVLEDYALQNIQLKTCMDTLGHEIARLRGQPAQ
jgi:hypothetical protein